MPVDFGVHPRGWPSVERYPATDFRDVIVDFLEASGRVHASGAVRLQGDRVASPMRARVTPRGALRRPLFCVRQVWSARMRARRNLPCPLVVVAPFSGASGSIYPESILCGFTLAPGSTTKKAHTFLVRVFAFGLLFGLVCGNLHRSSVGAARRKKKWRMKTPVRRQ
jgi:hypothetical protein